MYSRPGERRATNAPAFFLCEPHAYPFSLLTSTRDMADQEPTPTQDEQPKMEEANAPINIKVRQTCLLVFLPVAGATLHAGGGGQIGMFAGGLAVGLTRVSLRRW